MFLANSVAVAAAALSGMTLLNTSAATFARTGNAYDPLNNATRGTDVRRTRNVTIAGTTYAIDLMEASRTQKFLQSNVFSNASWTKTRASISGTVDNAPDGTASSYRLVEDSTASATHFMSQAPTLSATSHCLWFMVKASGVTQVGVENATLGVGTIFNLSTVAAVGNIGSAPTDSFIWAYPGAAGYYIVGILFTGTAAAHTCNLYLASGGTITYSGGGSNYVNVIHAQVENQTGSSTKGLPTSFIATTTVSVTRNADTLLSATAIAQTGSIIGLHIPYCWTGDADGVSVWSVSRSLANDAFRIQRSTAAAVSLLRSDAAGTQGGTLNHGLTNGALTQHGMRWESTAVKGFINGGINTADTVGLTPPYNASVNIPCGYDTNSTNRYAYGWCGILYTSALLQPNELRAIATSVTAIQ